MARRAPPGSGSHAARLAAAARAALDALLPPACVVCGRGVEPGAPPVCGLCWHRLPRLAPPFCRRCGATWTPLPGQATGPEAGCLECEGWPEIARAVAPYRLEGGAQRLVHALKYDGWTRLAEPMGCAMAETARRLLPPGEPVAVVPVPLAAARLRERGFNQAALLAEAMARAGGWPVADILSRRGTGRRQASLGRSSRLENVRGRFVTRGLGPAGHAVLLVDDVITTGSTAAACSAALAGGGTACAGVVSFARAASPLPGVVADRGNGTGH